MGRCLFELLGDAFVIVSHHSHAHFVSFFFCCLFPIFLVVIDQDIRTQAEQHLAQAVEAQYVRYHHFYLPLQIDLSLPNPHYPSCFVSFLCPGTLFVGFMC